MDVQADQVQFIFHTSVATHADDTEADVSQCHRCRLSEIPTATVGDDIPARTLSSHRCRYGGSSLLQHPGEVSFPQDQAHVGLFLLL